MNPVAYKISTLGAACAYATCGAGVVGHPVPDSHWGTRGAVVDAAGIAAFLLTALALVTLGPLLSTGAVGRWGVRLAQGGLVAMTIESLASLANGGTTLGGLFFGGLVATLAGLITLAAAGLRTGHQRWAAPLPALGLLVGIAGGDHGGFIATAVVWFILTGVGASSPLGWARVDHRPTAAATSHPVH
jgi:hypothetical protein